MNVISRHCINKDIIIYQHDHNNNHKLTNSFTYTELCEMIDFWKLLLVEKYHVKPGQTCLIDFAVLNVYYYSLFFAVAELGMVLIIDLPHAYNKDDINSYKINMHGKIDIIVTQKEKYDTSVVNHNPWDCIRNSSIGKSIIFQDEFDSYVIQDANSWGEISKTIYASPSDPLIYSSSSGTTGLPKKIIDSHQKVFLMAQRLGRLLQFRSTDSVLHTRNMHHGASMCYHFLPGFMIGKEQYTYTMTSDDDIPNITTFVQENKINKLFLYTSVFLTNFLKTTEPITHPVRITTLYQITLESLRLLKEKNIESIQSPFGDTTIGLGFFVKTVDQNTSEVVYDVSNMGPPSDDFFQCKVIDRQLYVRCPDLDEDWKTSNDCFDVIDNDFYFRGRTNHYRINHDWIKLNDLESVVNELFGINNANIVIDQEMQKIYLAVWKNNFAAEKSLNDYFAANYERAKIDFVLRNEKFEHFYNSRKIDNSKIREVCRQHLGLQTQKNLV